MLCCRILAGSSGTDYVSIHGPQNIKEFGTDVVDKLIEKLDIIGKWTQLLALITVGAGTRKIKPPGCGLFWENCFGVCGT